MKVKRTWAVELIVYSLTWLFLFGLNALAQVFWGVHLSLWWITILVVTGAIGDGFAAWLKKK